MANFFVWIAVLFVGIFLAIKFFEYRKGDGGFEEKRGKEYKYEKKRFFMTRAEHQCYDALVEAVSKDYYIFPQAHLTSIVDHKIKGQNWRGAFRHIDEKSVDFVLCDKNYIAPRLAIELDDRTHERMDRKLRDGEVERILKCAGLPLLRLDNHGSFDSIDLAQKIKSVIAGGNGIKAG